MTKELLQQAHDALITSLAYVDATSAIAEVQGALKAIEQALAQQEQPAQEAVAYELEAVKFANGKKLVYQKPENLASYIKVRTLVYADADPAPTQPAFTQEPPAKTGARIQAIVTSCLGCTHRRYNSGGIYYCEKLGSDLDPRETFHPLCPLQSLSPTQPALSELFAAMDEAQQADAEVWKDLCTRAVEQGLREIPISAKNAESINKAKRVRDLFTAYKEAHCRGGAWK